MNLRVLGLLSFFALAACNESSIPAFSGRLVNHSSIPSESFEITYVLSCKKESIVGPRPSCGYDSKTAKVDANGNYSMPALEVNSGGSMYDLKIEVRSNQDGMVASRTSEFWSFFDSSITKKAPAFKDITIFEVNTQKLNFELRSGIDSEQWANGNGRDSSVKYNFDFANSGESEYENSLVRSITSTAMDSESLEILPTQLLMVPGALAPNQEVTVTGVVNNGHLINFTKDLARNEARIPFSSLLPATLRSFSIDDSAHPIIQRTIDGAWNMTMNFHRRYTAGKESNMFDADLNLRCVNGSIEGEMHLVNRPASPRKFDGKVAVSGPCADEAGRIEFRFQFANDVQEQLVKIPYERIGGSPKFRRLLTRNLVEDNSAKYNGAKYSMFLPMLTEDGSQGQADTH